MDSSVGSRQRWVQADDRLADLRLYDTVAVCTSDAEQTPGCGVQAYSLVSGELAYQLRSSAGQTSAPRHGPYLSHT